MYQKSFLNQLEDDSQNIILMTERIVGVTASNTDNYARFQPFIWRENLTLSFDPAYCFGL